MTTHLQQLQLERQQHLTDAAAERQAGREISAQIAEECARAFDQLILHELGLTELFPDR